MSDRLFAILGCASTGLGLFRVPWMKGRVTEDVRLKPPAGSNFRFGVLVVKRPASRCLHIGGFIAMRTLLLSAGMDLESGAQLIVLGTRSSLAWMTFERAAPPFDTESGKV
jgi:hypothetical protein